MEYPEGVKYYEERKERWLYRVMFMLLAAALIVAAHLPPDPVVSGKDENAQLLDNLRKPVKLYGQTYEVYDLTKGEGK